MIITENFNHDYHDNQNIAHPYFEVTSETVKTVESMHTYYCGVELTCTVITVKTTVELP